MKANKKTLLAVKSYLEDGPSWDLEEMVSEFVDETGLLKGKVSEEKITLSMDECGIEWGGEEVCNLDDFIKAYTDEFIKGICNMLESFIGEDIDDYLHDYE
ncbi:MAG: hypothetical protein E7234_06030 [Lachnospiraceae bacterium]|nr:hypothetical protein [Lachnospiraceae bacterium]